MCNETASFAMNFRWPCDRSSPSCGYRGGAAAPLQKMLTHGKLCLASRNTPPIGNYLWRKFRIRTLDLVKEQVHGILSEQEFAGSGSHVKTGLRICKVSHVGDYPRV